MCADSLRTHPCAYDIEVMWGEDELLFREHVHPPVPFALVTSKSARTSGRTFWVDDAWIGTDSQELVTCRAGEVWLEHGDLSTRLAPGAELALTVGPLRIRVRGSRPEAVAAVRGRALDVRSHGFTLGSFALHLLALSCMALLPPRASSLSLDLATEDVGRMRYLLTAAERVDVLPWSEGAAAASSRAGTSAPSDSQVPTSQSRRPGGLSVRGKERERVARATQQNAGSQGILGALPTMQALLGEDSPFAGGVPIGYNLENLVGPDGPGSGTFGHLSLRNAGRPGGPGSDGDGPGGTIGVGTLDTGTGAKHSLAHTLQPGHRTSRVPRARMVGDAQVKGSLAKEVIRRTIQRHLNEVRYCYERALRDQPELSGRVAVSFLIAPSGEVQASALDESSMGSIAVEQCIVQAVRRWAFPAPEGGGYVRVSYPFLLESAAD